MKSLTCEMCGGTELIKQNGMYVCQSCGVKYSVEEAKKMMIEGTVDVSGSTVRVDNSELVTKYLANARRAKQKEDWEETEKYYNMVEQNDPMNIEAIFYSSYGKAKASLIEADVYKREAAFKVLTNCVSMIDDYFALEKETEQKAVISQISTDIFLMVSSSYVYNQKKNGYGFVVYDDRSVTKGLFAYLELEFINSLEHIISKYPEGDNRTIPFYEMAVKHANYIIETQHPKSSYRKIAYERVMVLHTAWNRIDVSHIVPEPKTVPEETSESSMSWKWFIIVGLVSVLVVVACMLLNELEISI